MNAATVSWVGHSYTDCYRCGALIVMTNSLYRQRINDRASFWCPNGHEQHFTGKTDAERVRDELNAVIAQRDRTINSVTQSLKWEQSSHKETRTKLTGQRIVAGKAKAETKRILTRVHAGVCPHCHRTFKQLAAHMKAKHRAAKK